MNTEKKFLEFHAANPHVYGALTDLVTVAKTRGYSKWGIGGMYEILRWEGKIKTTGDAEFKLRNDFRAYYARLLMANGDAPAGFFALRQSQADGVEMLIEDDWSDFEKEWE